MPFFYSMRTIIQKNLLCSKNAIPNPVFSIINPLAIQNILKQKSIQAIGETDARKKRAVLSASLCEGSLTVEAALALPLCLGVIFLLMGLFQTLAVCEQVNTYLCTTARQMAAYSESMDDMNVAGMYRLFYADISHSGIDIAFIQGGYSGIVLTLEDDLPDSALLKLNARYRVKIAGYLIPGKMLTIHDTVYVRQWTGQPFQGEQLSGGLEQNRVYVAETGVVYHTNENCTHLDLSVRNVRKSVVEKLRNQYGSRYVACEKCVKNNLAENVYITSTGTAWHVDRQCSGLKRQIQIMSEQDALQRGLRLCVRCGG